jgi:hypothetical protein
MGRTVKAAHHSALPDYKVGERENEDSSESALANDVVAVNPVPMMAGPMAWNPAIMVTVIPVSRTAIVKPSIAHIDVKTDCFRCCQHTAQAKHSGHKYCKFVFHSFSKCLRIMTRIGRLVFKIDNLDIARSVFEHGRRNNIPSEQDCPSETWRNANRQFAVTTSAGDDTGSTHLPCSRMRSFNRSTASASGILNFTGVFPTYKFTFPGAPPT